VAPSVELPLAELLAGLSERSPAPGAGSASAWAGALAAALLEMCSRFADADDVVQRARGLRAQLVACGDQELSSFQPVLDALARNVGDPSRERLLEEALTRASEPPLAIARAATEVAELAAAVAEQSKSAVKGDAVAGVLLAEAASQSAAHLVEINLEGRGGDPRIVEVAGLKKRVEAARARVLGN
jgi:formiminotetrahydrofolate cyclodeaminase